MMNYLTPVITRSAFILILILVNVRSLSGSPLVIGDIKLDGFHIGNHIEYINEKELFRFIRKEWNIDSAYIDKILSGELHSDQNFILKLEDTATGYKARIASRKSPEKEKIIQWGIPDILKHEHLLQFTESKEKVFKLNFNPHSYWCRLKIINTTDKAIECYIELNKNIYNIFDIFVPAQNGYITRRGGFNNILSKRTYHYKNTLHKIIVKSGTSTYYFRIDSIETDFIPLRIWSQNELNKHIIFDNAFHGTLFGIFLLIAVYNLIIYILIRNKIFFYLSLMTACGLFLHMLSSGFGFQHFWGNTPLASVFLLLTMFPLSYIFTLLFCRSFINIPVISPRNNKIITFMIYALLLVLPLLFILPDEIRNKLFIIIIYLENFYLIPVIISSIITIRRGNRSGTFMLVGIALLAISQIESLLTSLNIISYSLANYIHTKGIAFTVFMTLGIVDKYNGLQQNLSEMNIVLENKVIERTEALELANDKLKKVDKVKTRFFSNISHELRTPLTLILAPVESKLQDSASILVKKDTHFLQSIQRNGQKLLQMINNLLDLSKIEAGKMKINRNECNITQLITLCIASIEPLVAVKGLKIYYNNNTPDDLFIHADNDLIEKAIMNLLSNAIKFNKENGFIIVSLEKNNGTVFITVKDSGIGIEKEYCHLIFDRFSQFQAPSKRKHEGTGIGLSLTQEIVKLHEGAISVSSKSGMGSTFTMTFPVLKVIPENTDEEPNTRSLNGAGPVIPRVVEKGKHRQRNIKKKSKTVIIVEDNEDMKYYLGDLLDKYYITITVSNGEEALQVLEKQQIDLVLADVIMPYMDGHELIQQIRSNPRQTYLPIIFLTALSDISDKIKGIQIGANDYITKPFSPNELIARIESQFKFNDLRNKLQPIENQQKVVTDATINKIKVIKEFLMNNYYESFSREGLASTVNMSPDHLSRMFKQYTGEKITDYTNRIRIEKATLMLQETDKKIIDIAYDVGFESLRTFNKVFLYLKKMSPTNFRKEKNKT